MSTKSNNNAGQGGARAAVVRGGTLASDNRFLQRAQMELAYFSGFARLKQRRARGAGNELRFERVRPPPSLLFPPLKSAGITPEILHPTNPALKRAGIYIISLDEVCLRAGSHSPQHAD